MFLDLTNRATHAMRCSHVHLVRPCLRKAVEERESSQIPSLPSKACESFFGTFKLCRRITSAVFDVMIPAHSASIPCGLTLSRILKKPIELPTIGRNRTLSGGPHLSQEKLAISIRSLVGEELPEYVNIQSLISSESQYVHSSFTSYFRHLNSTTPYPLHLIQNSNL